MLLNKELPSNYICYRTITIDPNTMEPPYIDIGSWGRVLISTGKVTLSLLNDNKEILIKHVLSAGQLFLIPPYVWLNLDITTNDFSGQIDLYCHPNTYFNKKYDLKNPHSSVVALRNNYLISSDKRLDVLDLGAGRGRNSLYMSQFNNKVSAYDVDEKQIFRLEHIIKEEKIKHLTANVLDLEEEIITGHYDVVICTVVLQFLSKHTAWQLLSNAQKSTKIGGYHVIVCPVNTPETQFPKHFSFLLEPNQLIEFYRDKSWATLEYSEDFGHLHKTAKDGLPIRGRFATLIAQRVI
ncbi:MAG: methyltransferase domain-containing protein [Francisellaceae bacterium]|nr:methyltransferase domain-containing protein [Francisellaceae bacterium]MBT6206708.1 methyltransferase domain-containing protein [Francisellaceae bacterium]MBT6539932.1 methyltransferase domain-containing protein [Francisellaceae bacterium]